MGKVLDFLCVLLVLFSQVTLMPSKLTTSPPQADLGTVLNV